MNEHYLWLSQVPIETLIHGKFQANNINLEPLRWPKAAGGYCMIVPQYCASFRDRSRLPCRVFWKNQISKRSSQSYQRYINPSIFQ